ncbi:helicase HerA-like domain-containing protein [Ornithinimicrobium ciconiae]|uniref:helicase HerA-like domain-containing protein n=1 Tax=Ornithinimicrobium ciconiae TaxID=2594265 RepID=UPI001D181A80|nr:helicase HerA-like domain-containing protein [Ornithinimicrobium ciconiae]
MTENQLDQIRAGYSFEGPSITLGATLQDGTPVPDAPVRLPLASMNRHGLVAGATGTGKTVTLQVMAEQLSAEGVPVFLADIKGDLTGLVTPAGDNPKVTERMTGLAQEWAGTAYPVEFFSLGGQGKGIPIRATITGFGPILLSKVLGLNDTQESSLGLIFHYAAQAGLALLDIKDLRAVVQHLLSDEGKAELKALGGLSTATAGVILRELIAFEAQGADAFFGEPEFDTADLLRTAEDGRGIISCLELPGVQDKPALFSTFLMWLLADLFQDLPEVGNLDKPKLVFFFDEAHLLFKDASKAFLESIEQAVRLIRSKGVGVFFVTQVPKDVPESVLAQLGNRVQHALRAFTPSDAKALKATAKTFPISDYDLEEVLTQLGTGEAVVTVLSDRGAPTPVAWTLLRAPQGTIGPSPEATVDGVISASPLTSRYAEELDRESAYEILAAKMEAGAKAAEEAAAAEAAAGASEAAQKEAAAAEKAARKREKEDPSVVDQVVGSSAFKSMLRSAGTVIGREISRSIFGTGRRR